MPDLVTVSRRGPVALLTLNDPAQRNVLSSRMVAQIDQALTELEGQPSVTAVVVTGAGPSFCAGAELSTLEQAADGDFTLVRRVYTGFTRFMSTPLLTIAAINGPAVGAGLNLALACDIRIAADSARFVPRFAELRIFPGGGHTWLLSRAIGQQAATMALLSGRTWDGRQATEAGLAAQCVPRERVVDAALALAGHVGELEAEYVRRLVSVLRSVPLLLDHNQALEIEAEHQHWSIQQPAFRRGLAQLQQNLRARNEARA